MRITRISFLALAWVLASGCDQSLKEIPGADSGARDAARVDTWSFDGRATDSPNTATPDSSLPDRGVDRSRDTEIRDTLPGGPVLDARDTAPSDTAVDTAVTTDVRDAPTIDARDAPTIDVREAPRTDVVDASLRDGGDTNPANPDASDL